MPIVQDFNINGECMVYVKGGEHLSGRPMHVKTELGLSNTNVVLSFQHSQKELMVDDFGPDTPADIIALISSVKLTIPLIHFNREVLGMCLDESWGGANNGILAPGGKLLGGNKPLYASGNHFVAVSLASHITGIETPWRFKACYMMGPPMEYPLGVGASLIQTTWRAIPYTQMVSGEIRSSGAILWDFEDDFPVF